MNIYQNFLNIVILECISENVDDEVVLQSEEVVLQTENYLLDMYLSIVIRLNKIGSLAKRKNTKISFGRLRYMVKLKHLLGNS